MPTPPTLLLSYPLAAASLCGLSLFLSGCAPAEPDAVANSVVVHALLSDGPAPTLTSPKRLGPCERGTRGPTWLNEGEVVRQIPQSLYGLSHVEKAGLPVFDPSTRAWHASANGSLVRVDRDGLTVIADGVQGIDVDVRADLGLVVSREPNDTIVLRRFSESSKAAQVLFTGPAFFRPRFSPNGDAVIVCESKVGGGRIWLKPQTGEARDLTQGVSPSWHPDGRHVVFARIEHDGRAILSSELWMVDAKTGEERRVGGSPIPAVEPAISPDGAMVAFVDGRTRDVYLARFDDPFAGGSER